MRHDLSVVRGKLVVRRFGVRAIGQVVVENAKVLHFPDPVFECAVEMAGQIDLVNGLKDAPEGSSIDHVARRFLHEYLFGRAQADAVYGFGDLLVFFA